MRPLQRQRFLPGPGRPDFLNWVRFAGLRLADSFARHAGHVFGDALICREVCDSMVVTRGVGHVGQGEAFVHPRMRGSLLAVVLEPERGRARQPQQVVADVGAGLPRTVIPRRSRQVIAAVDHLRERDTAETCRRCE